MSAERIRAAVEDRRASGLADSDAALTTWAKECVENHVTGGLTALVAPPSD